MKTLNTAVVNFVNSNSSTLPSVQEYFNGMLEGLSPSEVLVGGYYSSLTVIGKGLFNNLFTEVSEEVVSISKTIKTRSIKLRKQVSAVAKKRHVRKVKVARATGGLFKTSLFEVMEFRAKQLLQRVGITPTDTPILELMSIPLQEAGFIFNTVSLSSEVKCLLNLAAQVLAA